jgi:hypothetical protein
MIGGHLAGELASAIEAGIYSLVNCPRQANRRLLFLPATRARLLPLRLLTTRTALLLLSEDKGIAQKTGLADPALLRNAWFLYAQERQAAPD